MNSRVAKRLRKSVYGELSLRTRQHFHNPKVRGTVIADPRRQSYQELKRAYKRGEVRL